MQIKKDELKKTGHERAWQYFLSVHNAVSAMQIYELATIHCLKLKQSNFIDIIEGHSEICVEEKHSFPPGDWIKIEGCNVSLSFIVWLNAYNFFQSSRNCFDYMAQIIAEFSHNDKLKHIDFETIVNHQDSFQNDDLKKWISDIKQSELYQFVNDYCNTVKHNHDMPTSISVQTCNLEMTGYIPEFEKQIKHEETHTYEKSGITEQMESVRKFTVDAYQRLLDIIFPTKVDEKNNQKE